MRPRLFRVAAVILATVPAAALAGRKVRQGIAPASAPLPESEENVRYDGFRFSAASSVIDLYPATDSTFASGSVKLYWHSTELAVRYRVQLASDGDFRGLVFDRTGTETSVPAVSLRPGRYFWRVAAIDALGVPSFWSTTSDFEVRGKVERARATLHWRPASRLSIRFSVRIARDAKFAQTVAEKNTESAFWVTDPLPQGRYFWHVEDLDAEGKKVETSPARSFTIGDGGIVTYEGD